MAIKKIQSEKTSVNASNNNFGSKENRGSLMQGNNSSGMAIRDVHVEDAVPDILVIRGTPSTCVFVHSESEIIVVMHGDDFTSFGRAEEVGGYRQRIHSN